MVDRYKKYLHQKILFSDGALMSASARRATGETGVAHVGEAALAADLENYVFAYLGIHNPLLHTGPKA